MRCATESIPKGLDLGGLTPVLLRYPRVVDEAQMLDAPRVGLCPCPHWGYALKGCMLILYRDGSAEEIRAGDVYYLPGGHTARIEVDFVSIEFSPLGELREALARIAEKSQTNK